METVRGFILGGSKITADGDCSHEIKRHLLLGRKAMTNLVKWKLLNCIWFLVTQSTIYSLWNSPGQNTGVGSLSLLQGIFPTQGLNPGLPHCRRILYQLSHQGSQPRQHIKKQRHCFANKGPSSQSYGFSSSHVWMWELDYKGSWVLKNWCFWTMVLERILESPLDCKEIKRVNPKGNQSWIFIGRTDAEAETPILWPLEAKSWLTGKDPDARKDWRWEEKGTTEDEMVAWHHWLNGHLSTNSRSWWWTGRPGVLQSVGSQRVGHN